MANAKGSLRSDLGRVRGLGSAKEGVAHWWAQRITALALIPLSLWFVACIVFLIDVDRVACRAEWRNELAEGSVQVLRHCHEG